LRERVSNLLTKVVEDALRISTPLWTRGQVGSPKFLDLLRVVDWIIKLRKMRIILALSGC